MRALNLEPGFVLEKALGQQHLHRNGPWDLARQAHVRPPGGNDPPADFTEAEAGVLDRDTDIGPLHELHPARDAEPVDRTDDRLEHVGERTLGVILVAHLIAGLEHRDRFLEVHAGAERLVAVGREDRDPQLGIVLEVLEARIHRAQHLGRERIHGVGPVDRHHGDATALLVLKCLGQFDRTHGLGSLLGVKVALDRGLDRAFDSGGSGASRPAHGQCGP